MRIRPYNESDLDKLVDLFRDSVRNIASRDYSPEQVEAWAPDDLDPVAFAGRLSRNTSYVAEIDGKLVGFGELEPLGHVAMLYVHSAYQRRGVAARLLERLEETARERNLDALTTEASITARPFFERHGFRVVAPQTVIAGGVRFANFHMEKALP